MQRIDKVGWQTFVKQKSEDVVAVVSGSLKPYFYFAFRAGTAVNGLQQCIKSLRIVLDGKYICQNFTFRAKVLHTTHILEMGGTRFRKDYCKWAKKRDTAIANVSPIRRC